MTEKKTGWTPGPWAFEIFPEGDERNMPPEEWTGVFIGPEDVETGKPLHTIFEGGFTHGPEDGDPFADGYMMAAAPDLYSCLADAVDLLEQAGFSCISHKDALRKARGE